MLTAIKVYGVTLGLFLLIDMIWLGLISPNFYRKHLGFLMKTEVNWIAAVAFYLIFVAGIVFFVVYPAISRDSLLFAALAGGFFGLVAYATYDLTNLATIRHWPPVVTVVDLVWGTVLSGTLATIGFLFGRRLF